jgi:two-component system sensor histidine kinase BaeS
LTSTGTLSTVVQTEAGPLLVEGRVLQGGAAVLMTEPQSLAGLNVGRDIARLLFALGVGVAIAIVSGLILARRLARPLKSAAAAADQMAHGRRDVVIVPEGPQEVAEVADSLNGLNQALAVSEARQREFLLSVSHELRTPLTSLRGYAEAMADGVVPADQVAATGGVMVTESERLERIVADLLDLARMGAREVRIDAVPTDVGPVLAEAAQVWADLCAAEGVDFRAELPASLQDLPRVVTDPVRLRQMVDNLLANALRMTPPGRPIVLAARVAPDDAPEQLLIEVRDGGPGLTDDDLAVAFEPAELYSRYRGVRQVGSGVGLALVGRLAARLGGRAQAGHAQEGGAAFLIELPLSGPSIDPVPVAEG